MIIFCLQKPNIGLQIKYIKEEKMLKKLIAGELSLADTFWKFGVMGMCVCLFIIRFISGILAGKLHGVSIFTYFSKYFSFFNMNTSIVLLSFIYLICLAAFVWYSMVLLLGIWRSSSKYDKSIWLRHITRVVTLVLLFMCYQIVF